MSDADPSTPTPTPDQASPVQGPPAYSTHLITLIRGLITYGQNLLTTVRARNEPPEVPAFADLAMFFGTARVALIIARITRGLMFAGLLERRLRRSVSRLDNSHLFTVTPRTRPVKRGPRVRHPKPVTDDAALLERLPTEQEIAARLLRDLVTRARAHRWRPPDLVGDPASAPLSVPLPAAGTGPP